MHVERRNGNEHPDRWGQAQRARTTRSTSASDSAWKPETTSIITSPTCTRSVPGQSSPEARAPPPAYITRMAPTSGRSALSALLGHLLVGRGGELRGLEPVLLLPRTSSLEHPGHVGLDVEAVPFRCGDHAKEDRPPSSALAAPGEERVEPQARVVLEGAFAPVVVDGDTRVVDESGEVVEVAEIVAEDLSERSAEGRGAPRAKA
jgi:hypothetical protein